MNHPDLLSLDDATAYKRWRHRLLEERGAEGRLEELDAQALFWRVWGTLAQHPCAQSVTVVPQGAPNDEEGLRPSSIAVRVTAANGRRMEGLENELTGWFHSYAALHPDTAADLVDALPFDRDRTDVCARAWGGAAWWAACREHGLAAAWPRSAPERRGPRL